MDTSRSTLFAITVRLTLINRDYVEIKFYTKTAIKRLNETCWNEWPGIKIYVVSLQSS